MKIAAQLERAGQAHYLPPVTRGSLKVHIEKLVLHGFARSDRHRIADAVEQELARLMSAVSTTAWQRSSPVVEEINAGVFKVAAGAKPQTAGTEIARAIFRSLRQHARAPATTQPKRPALRRNVD